MRKQISFILAVVMVMAVMVTAIPVSAASDTYETTKNDAIVKISTVADLKAFFFEMTKNGNKNFKGQTVQLQNDIVFNDASYLNWTEDATNKLTAYEDTTSGWEVYSFAGTFDGNNKKLTGVYVDASVGAYKSSGFIPLAANAVIKNLTMDRYYVNNALNGTGSAKPEGGYGVGSLVGRAGGDSLTIDNVVVMNGTVTTDEDYTCPHVANDEYIGIGGIIGVRMPSDGASTGYAKTHTITITNSTFANIRLEAGTGTLAQLGGILGSDFCKWGYGYTEGAHKFVLTGTTVDMGEQEIEALGGMVGGNKSWRKHNYVVVGENGTTTTAASSTLGSSAKGLTAALQGNGYIVRVSTYAADTADANRGTPENPIRITTTADYKLFFKDIVASNDKKVDFTGKTVQLQNNIVFNDIFYEDWAANPQNKLTQAADTAGDWNCIPFSGTFDGQGYTLYGVYVDLMFSPHKASGLFPMTKNTTIKNLNVEGFYINNNLKKSTYNANSVGGYSVGALIGRASGSVAVDNVSFKNGIVTCDSEFDGYGDAHSTRPTNIGGVIGSYVYSEVDNLMQGKTIAITNTTVTNDVVLKAGEGTTAKIGGIVGNHTFNQGTNVSGTTTYDLSGSSINPQNADVLNPIGTFNGSNISTRKDTLEVVNTKKSYSKEISGIEAPFQYVVTAIRESGAYDVEEPKVEVDSDVKFVGAQTRTDGNGIRFLGAVKDISALEALGFSLKIDLGDGKGDTIISVDKTMVKKVYSEVLNVPKPEGYNYLFTFAITGISEIAANPKFTVSTYIDSKNSEPETGEEYTWTFDYAKKESTSVTIYPEFDDRIERDYMYSVSVSQGAIKNSIPVYNHQTDDYMVRNPKDSSANEYRRFSTFAFDEAKGKVRVDIKVNTDFNTYSVLPAAKDFETDYSDGVISVFLDKPEYFSVRLDGKDSTLLSVFADGPEEQIPEGALVIDGWTEVPGGILRLNKEDQVVYLKPGAVLNARVVMSGDNCTLMGRGMILDPASSAGNEYDKTALGKDVITVTGSKNTVKDIHIVNAFGFNIFVHQDDSDKNPDTAAANGNSVNNVKILSTQLSSDGMSFGYGSSGSSADNCYIYCGDNAIVAESNCKYTNISIGTTCNAIFPQGSVVNTTIENIYVFRADEGLINHDYCEQASTNIDYTIRNLYATDITHMPSVVKIENRLVAGGTSTNKYVSVDANGDDKSGLYIENLYLPTLSNVGTGSFYHTTDGVSGSKYSVTLKHVSIGGIADTSSKYTAENGAIYYITFETNDSTFKASTPMDKLNQAANYTDAAKVFVGGQQIYLNSVIVGGGVFKLPYDEMLKYELYFIGEVGTQYIETINHMKYIRSDKLAEVGMAASVSVDVSTLTITPNTPSNLFLDKDGEVSELVETGTTGNTYISKYNGVYTLRNLSRDEKGDPKTFSTGSSIGTMIDDEIRKFGVGTYTFTFQARSATAGASGSISLRYYTYKNGDKDPIEELGSQSSVADLNAPTDDFVTCSLTFTVTEEHLANYRMLMVQIVLPSGGSMLAVDIKDITLVKS